MAVSKKQFVIGFLWKYGETFLRQFMLFVVQVFMARVLTPSDFGVIALMATFIYLANIFVQSGFNLALIQKKDIDLLDFSSVFYLTIFIATGIYILLFLISEQISIFFKEPKLVPIMRTLPIVLLLGSVNSIQIAFASRNMDFKSICLSTSVASIVSGIVGLTFVYSGGGIWALVIQQILNYIILTIMLFKTVRWTPIFAFSIERIRPLFTYGWKVMFSSLCSFVNEDSYGIVIGKAYSSTVLGYYNRGYVFPSTLVVSNLNGTLMSVLFPTLSSYQDDREKLKHILSRSISVSSFLVFPAMAGMVAVAKPMITVLLTDKWLPSVPYLIIECLFFSTVPILTSASSLINSMGRSDINLKISLFKVIATILSIGVFMNLSVFYILGMKCIVSLIIVFICMSITKRLVAYDICDCFDDVANSLFSALLMGGGVYILKFIIEDNFILFLTQIFTGGSLYLSIAYFTKNKSLRYIVDSFYSNAQ